MAFAGYDQDFDGLNDGDLNTQDSWTGDTSFDVQTSVVNSGTKAVIGNHTGSGESISRDDGAVGTDGTQVFYFRLTSVTTAELMQCRMMEGASPRGYMKNDGSGNFQYYDGGAYNTVGSLSNDTWHKMVVEWRVSPSQQWRHDLDGTGFTDWDTMVTWTSGLDGNFLARTSLTGSVYWDDFASSDTPAASAVTPTPQLLTLGVG